MPRVLIPSTFMSAMERTLGANRRVKVGEFGCGSSRPVRLCCMWTSDRTVSGNI